MCSHRPGSSLAFRRGLRNGGWAQCSEAQLAAPDALLLQIFWGDAGGGWRCRLPSALWAVRASQASHRRVGNHWLLEGAEVAVGSGGEQLICWAMSRMLTRRWQSRCAWRMRLEAREMVSGQGTYVWLDETSAKQRIRRTRTGVDQIETDRPNLPKLGIRRVL